MRKASSLLALVTQQFYLHVIGFWWCGITFQDCIAVSQPLAISARDHYVQHVAVPHPVKSELTVLICDSRPFLDLAHYEDGCMAISEVDVCPHNG